jgi:putative acetyltransferase
MHRLATQCDAKRLFELRRRSIVALAPKAMSVPQAKNWAENLTITAMERKLREFEIWVVEQDDAVVGWGAIAGDRLEGLYVAPEFAGRGIGTELLGVLERLLRERGVLALRAEASANAEGFYLRLGYEPIGPVSPEGARPIMKRLSCRSAMCEIEEYATEQAVAVVESYIASQ